MVKSIVSIAICLALIVGGAVFEHSFVNRQFGEFTCVVDSLYEKTQAETANKQDVAAAQECWRKKKGSPAHIHSP